MSDTEHNTTPTFAADTQHRLHKRTFGATKRYDGSELLREATIPQREKKSLRLIVVIGAIIAFFFLLKTFDVLLFEPMRIEASIQANVSREVAYEFPRLSDYIFMNNDEVLAAETDAGHTTVAVPGGDNENGSLDVMKLPSDIDYDRGVAMLEKGIAALSPDQAALMLRGSYRLTVDRSDGTTMRVRYADFESETHEEAISKALETQNFEAIEYAESGVDTSGNTYQMGTFTRDDHKFAWRISVINLDEIYDIGMPKGAIYVGIRVETT